MKLNALIENTIREIFLNADKNKMPQYTGEPMWDTRTLIGFSRGDDPLYKQFKEDIGDFLMTPLEAFNAAFPDAHDMTADRLSVVSFVMPQTSETKKEQRMNCEVPARRWALSRLNCAEFHNAVIDHVREELAVHGYRLTSPYIEPYFQDAISLKYGMSSGWSERHVAYICGLGTFGHCDALITPLGKSVRLASFVVDAQLTPTDRAYSNYKQYCLHDEGCSKCAERCPVGAITDSGHDKETCWAYLDYVADNYIMKEFGTRAETPCGLCQSNVPCENGIPQR